jgi:Flp pilus assembly protein TadG
MNRIPLRSDGGQSIVLVVLMLPVLLGIAGLVIDVGHGYLVQRQLQGAADAAALAGAANLPDDTAAVSVARRFGTGPGGSNAIPENVNESIAERCLTTFGGCRPHNAVTVSETATVGTRFARILGVDTFTVRVKSTACSPCGSKPLDIVIVLDRTLSMCMDHAGNYSSSCTDLANAKEGVLTFLKLLDPGSDHVGLAVLPPAPSSSKLCAAPPLTTAYDTQSSPYVLVPLSSNYASRPGTLVPTSALVSTVNCVSAGGETAYALALEAAQAELDAHGRAGVQQVILFFSDGAANTGPSWLPKSSPYRSAPCHQGVTSAASVKASGTIVYSIGYDLSALNGGANECRAQSYQGPLESPPITAYDALSMIASAPEDFYNQPDASELDTLFTNVAYNMLSGTAKLVSNETP